MKSLLSIFFLASISLVDAKTITVKIEAMKFEPDVVNAQAGDTIEWDNRDFFPHTVTALNKSFDSGSISSMGKWSFKAIKTGKFKYKCLFHPVMSATLIVVPADLSGHGVSR